MPRCKSTTYKVTRHLIQVLLPRTAQFGLEHKYSLETDLKVRNIPANRELRLLPGTMTDKETLVLLTFLLFPQLSPGDPSVDPSDLEFEPTANPSGRLLVPSSEEFKRVGEGSFIQRKDGAIMLFFDARGRIRDTDTSIIRVIQSTDNGTTWDAPRTVLFDPEASILQPSLCRLGNGRMGMSYSRLIDRAHAEKYFVSSDDEGQTWSSDMPISKKECTYMTGPHDRLIKLSTGRLVSLIHGKKIVKRPSHLVSYVFTSDDNGDSWINCTPEGLEVDLNPYEKHEYGFWEMSLIEGEGGKALVYGRTATGYLYLSRSGDYGSSWSSPQQTDIPNSLAPVRVTRIPETRTILMFCNPIVDMRSDWHGGPRRVLAVRASTDFGVKWSALRMLEYTTSENRWFDYPFVKWLDDTLHLGYRAPRRDTWEMSLYYQRIPKIRLMRLPEP